MALPFVAVLEDDAAAFWCFERFMQRARRNFRSDEAGIQCARMAAAAYPLRMHAHAAHLSFILRPGPCLVSLGACWGPRQGLVMRAC